MGFVNQKHKLNEKRLNCYQKYKFVRNQNQQHEIKTGVKKKQFKLKFQFFNQKAFILLKLDFGYG